ncbi:MAG TPA: hypothetical protein V6C78_29595 [Crinalium sp.]|jgi:hypothetical protein
MKQIGGSKLAVDEFTATNLFQATGIIPIVLHDSAHMRQAAAHSIIFISSLIISHIMAHFSHISAQSIQVRLINSEPPIIMFMHIMHISAQSRSMDIMDISMYLRHGIIIFIT